MTWNLTTFEGDYIGKWDMNHINGRQVVKLMQVVKFKEMSQARVGVLSVEDRGGLLIMNGSLDACSL